MIINLIKNHSARTHLNPPQLQQVELVALQSDALALPVHLLHQVIAFTVQQVVLLVQ
jgi:hypothetical protein